MDCESEDGDVGPGWGGPSPPPPPPVDHGLRCKKINSDLARRFPRKIERAEERVEPRAPAPVTIWRPEHRLKELGFVETVARHGAIIPTRTTIRKRYIEVGPQKPTTMRQGNLGILIDASGSMAVGQAEDGYVSNKWCMAMKAAMGFVNMAERFNDMVTVALYAGEGVPLFRRSRDYQTIHSTLCNMTHTPEGGTCIWRMGIQYIWVDSMATRCATNIIISDGNPYSVNPKLAWKTPIGRPLPDGTYNVKDLEFTDKTSGRLRPWPKKTFAEVLYGEYFIRQMLDWGPVIVIVMAHGFNADEVNEAREETKRIINHPNFECITTTALNWEKFADEITPIIERASEYWLEQM